MKDRSHEDFLMYLLRFYEKNEPNGSGIVNRDIVRHAVKKTMDFLAVEDKIFNTDHVGIFKTAFLEQKVSATNCQSIGISPRTFYRYKKLYLEVFGNYLSQNADPYG